MTTSEARTVITPASDEKLTQIMVYMPLGLYWGDVIVKEVIRVSTWLRTSSAPDIVTLHNANWLPMRPSGENKPLRFPDLHLPTSQIMAYHLMPPAKDPLDYDATEPNRKMEPVSVLVGSFRMDGLLRMASITDLSRYLTVNRELFTAIYDAEICNPIFQAVGLIRVPFVLVRQSTSIFANRVIPAGAQQP